MTRNVKCESKRDPPEEYKVGIEYLAPGVTMKSLSILPRRRRASYDTVLLDRKDRIFVFFKLDVDSCF